MMRKIAYMSAMLLTFGAASAAPISPEKALQRLGISDDMNLINTRSLANPVLLKTMNAPDGQTALYVFSNGDNGFMIVSGDDTTTPLLGYSDQGSFDPGNVAPGLQYWLSEYARQIEFNRGEGAVASTRAGENVTNIILPNTWTPIEPFVKTSWNQDAPFNDLCPMAGKTKSPTGCVATSMSQAMYYFQWPERPKGGILEYQCQSLGNKTLSLDLSKIKFDWNNMLLNYTNGYNTDQANAVATLMQVAGYGVEMNYSASQSGAVSGMIPYAMINYFNYSDEIKYYSRGQFTYTEWATMLYNNLKNVGPVIYDGTGEAGGHSFIFDGYQGNGYFHINWGWGGISDGYFLIDALNPPGVGIGGGTGGFNFSQGAIFDLKPNKTGSVSAKQQSEIILSGTLTATMNQSNLIFSLTGASSPGWHYLGTSGMDIFLGAVYMKADDPNAEQKFLQGYMGSGNSQLLYFTLDGQGYWPSDGSRNPRFNLNPIANNLETGVEYKFISAYQHNGSTYIVPSDIGYYNYVYVTKTKTGFTVRDEKPIEFSSNGISMDTPLYDGSAVKFSGSISNPAKTELTRTVSLALLTANDQIAFLGNETFVFSVAPGSSLSGSWVTGLTRQAGIRVTEDTAFYPALYDPTTGVIGYKAATPVTMHPSPGTAKATCSSVVVDNCSVNEKGIYIVPNAADFSVTSTIKCSAGYFTDNILLGILSPSSQSGYWSVDNVVNGGYAFMEKGETVDFTIPVSFPTCEVGSVYYVTPMILNNNQYDTLQPSLTTGFIALSVDGTGVEGILADSGDIMFVHNRFNNSMNITGGANGIVSVEAYRLNGMRAPLDVDYASGKAYVDFSGLGKGIVILTATDSQGNHKSIKLAL